MLISHPPELARAIRPFLANADLPVIGTAAGPEYGSIVALRHCHDRMKMRMLADAGYCSPLEAACSDSSADLPLPLAARRPVVVNPKPARIALFRRLLPAGTPIFNWCCPGRGWGIAPFIGSGSLLLEVDQTSFGSTYFDDLVLEHVCLASIRGE